MLDIKERMYASAQRIMAREGVLMEQRNWELYVDG